MFGVYNNEYFSLPRRINEGCTKIFVSELRNFNPGLSFVVGFPMKSKLFQFVVLSLIVQFYVSCDNSRIAMSDYKDNPNYLDINVLDSLIELTPLTRDTVFLGFTLGMTKPEYKRHIHDLRKRGNTITYSDNNSYSYLVGSFELGAGYTFQTQITLGSEANLIKGEGKYFLDPQYSRDGKLTRLNIVLSEDWHGDHLDYDKPSWFKSNIKKNFDTMTDQGLRDAMYESNMIDELDFVGQNGNVVVYETASGVSYTHLNTLYNTLRFELFDKLLATDKSESVTFSGSKINRDEMVNTKSSGTKRSDSPFRFIQFVATTGGKTYDDLSYIGQVVSEKVPGKNIYRYKIRGRFSDEDVERVKRQLEQAGYPGAYEN